LLGIRIPFSDTIPTKANLVIIVPFVTGFPAISIGSKIARKRWSIISVAVR